MVVAAGVEGMEAQTFYIQKKYFFIIIIALLGSRWMWVTGVSDNGGTTRLPTTTFFYERKHNMSSPRSHNMICFFFMVTSPCASFMS